MLNLLSSTTVRAQQENNSARLTPQPTTHKFNARYLPPGDPNLDPTWDWKTLPSALPNPSGHPTYYQPSTGPIQSGNTQVPFYTNGHPLADAVTNAAKDMQPADGWMLVYRDFGTPQAAPTCPFFVLYNKYRGTLRVMIKNQYMREYTAYKMSLTFRSSSPREALMTFTSDNHTTLDNYNGLNVNDGLQVDSFYGNTTAEDGWFFGDFMLSGYDPSINDNAVMTIRLVGIDKSTITLNSTQFSLDQVLNNNNPGDTGGNTFGFGLTKYFSSYASVIKALSGAGIISGTVGGAAAAATTGGFVGLFPVAIDLINMFIGGEDKTSPREPLRMKGVLNMTGGIESNLPVWTQDFALSMNKRDAPEIYRPVQPIPWGVFNLNNRPEFIQTLNDVRYEYDNNAQTWFDVYDYAWSLAQPITYSVNPNIGVSVESVELGSDMYGFMSLNDFNATTYALSGNSSTSFPYSQGSRPPTKIYLKVKLHINNPVINSAQNILIFKDLGLDKPASSNRAMPGSGPAVAAPAYASREAQSLSSPLTVAVSPNPIVGNARIQVNTPTAGPVTVRILNVVGKEVWRQTRNSALPGGVQFTWDDHNFDGKKLPSGEYFIEVTTAEQRKTHRVLIQ